MTFQHKMGIEILTAESAYVSVDRALRERGIEFSRQGLQYDIPNFSLCFDRVVRIASDALSGTTFYAQEVPYREEMPKFRPDHMLVLDRDERK